MIENDAVNMAAANVEKAKKVINDRWPYAQTAESAPALAP